MISNNAAFSVLLYQITVINVSLLIELLPDNDNCLFQHVVDNQSTR
jgi:hypothetical protein